MRIITGKARGVRLDTLEGEATRPTSEKVKEAVFSAIQFEVEGRRTLDLFGGSGQMGLEALSRGGSSCMFIDSSPDAMSVIKRNALKTGFFDSCRFLISDYRSYIRKAAGRDRYDLIFIDPPYASMSAGDTVSRILDAKIAADGCIFVLESGNDDVFHGMEDIADKFETVKHKSYGRTFVRILKYIGDKEI